VGKALALGDAYEHPHFLEAVHGRREVSERVRIDFAKRIGMGDLLEARVAR
jgi:hypothetical protein